MSLSADMRTLAGEGYCLQVYKQQLEEWANRVEKLEKALTKLASIENLGSCWAITLEKLYETKRLAHEALGEEETRKAERTCGTCGYSGGWPNDCEHDGDCVEFSGWKSKKQ